MNPERQPSNEADKFEGRYRELRERLEDPKHLPSLKELKTIFEYSLNQGNRKDWYDFVGPERHLNRETGNYEDKPGAKWKYEILTQEHIGQLSTYLQQRAEKYGATPQNPLRILEVGAGDGRLTHFLSENLSNTIRLEATDSGHKKIKPEFPVTIIKGDRGETDGLGPIEKAMQEYQPDIVISSWMPINKDWTKTFRDMPSVKEYILIGDPEVCAQPWETWGTDLESNRPKDEAPFAQDGFSATHLKELEKFQVCRTDHVLDDESHSDTVSFRRE